MFKKFLAALTASVLVLMPVAALAQGSGGAVSFEIMAPTTATAGEAIDVTVRALDKEKKTATEYRGSVTFLTDWIGDTVPMPGRSIAFSAEDQGEKKFSKGVIFKKPGKNKLIVSDVDGDVRGEVTITVVEGAGGSTNSEGEISIITPENNGKITSNTLSVSGKTRKNSKVTLKLNGTDVGSVISDDAGLFTKEIQGISQENNILSASLIDANNAVIGKPAEVNFTRVNESGSIYGLTIAPSTKVEVSSEITLTIEAVKGLAEVSAVLDGTSMTAKEVSDGKYTIKTTAPAKEGEYPITVNAKTVTGQSTVKENMAALMVSPKAVDAPLPAFKNIKAVTQDSRVTFSFEIENTPADLDAFKITHGATGSIMTHQANSIVKNGVYTWYVDQLPPQDYTFKIHGQKADGSTIE